MKSKSKSTQKKEKTVFTSKGPVTILPPPTQPLTEAYHVTEDPNARGTHGSAGRDEIRATTHRVMPSRQSKRPAERHNQPRKKRG